MLELPPSGNPDAVVVSLVSSEPRYHGAPRFGRLETIPGASPPLSWWGSRSVNNMSPFYSRVKREYIKSIVKEAFRNPHGVDFGSGIFVGRQVNLSGVLSFFGVSLPNGKTN